MGSPRIARNLVLAPPGVAARTPLHFEHDEVGDSPLMKTPGSTESGDATTNDDNLLACALRSEAWGQCRSQQMAPPPAIVHKPTGRTASAFARQADQRSAQKQAA